MATQEDVWITFSSQVELPVPGRQQVEESDDARGRLCVDAGAESSGLSAKKFRRAHAAQRPRVVESTGFVRRGTITTRR